MSHKPSNTMHRRTFLHAGTAAAAMAAQQTATAQQPDNGFVRLWNDKPRRVGLIGSGWYGKSDLLRLIQIAPVEVTGLCDVDKNMLEAAGALVATRQKSGKTPKLYHDYRDMLKAKEMDLVLIATPDHWHALPMIAAAQAGLDIYVQKPIGVDIIEGQSMLAAARKYNRVVQVGTQRRSTPHLVEARQLIQSGKLGKISEVELYCYYHMRAKANPPDEAAPANLDYEFWTGPAPMRPYNKLVHPRSWRAFMEYGNGIVGDMCVHMLDAARWMMDLGWPTQVSSTGGILVDKASKANITDTQLATFDFDGVKMVWNHRSWGTPNDPEYPWGLTFYGEKGTLKASVMGYDFIPVDRKEQAIKKKVRFELEEYPEDKTEVDLERHVAPAIRHHLYDFLKAVDNRTRPVADIEQAHISTTACILANMSQKLGRSLAWDPAKHLIIGDAEANKLLRRPYRKPWVHPEPNKV